MDFLLIDVNSIVDKNGLFAARPVLFNNLGLQVLHHPKYSLNACSRASRGYVRTLPKRGSGMVPVV